jgi:kynureninase
VYANGIERFQSGTPNVPALAAASAGYRIVSEIGVPAIRAKSLRLTRRMLAFADARGWRINTPLADAERGGSVVIDVPDGARVADTLIKRNVIVDYRPGAGIRLAPHFYNTEEEVETAMDTMAEVVTSKI